MVKLSALYDMSRGLGNVLRCKILEGYFRLERVETVSICVEIMPICLPKCPSQVEYTSNTCRFDVDIYKQYVTNDVSIVEYVCDMPRNLLKYCLNNACALQEKAAIN